MGDDTAEESEKRSKGSDEDEPKRGLFCGRHDDRSTKVNSGKGEGWR